jgi:hypothetical protein
LPWAAAQADNSAAANYNSATWTDLTQTVNGTSSATAVLTAMPASITGQGVVSWFDIVNIDAIARTDTGKTLPGISIRVEWLAGTNWAYLPAPFSSPAIWETDSVANGGRFYRVRGQAVSAGQNATKANLTNTATWGFCPPILIRYWPRSGKPKTLLIGGDSISSATGGTGSAVNLTRYGWAEMLRTQYSTPSRPIEIVNCSLGGAGFNTVSAMMNTVVPAVTNAVCILPNGTPNGTSNTLGVADVLGWNGFKAKMRALLEQYRLPYFFWTMLPAGVTAKTWGATDSLRQAMNTNDISSGQNVIKFAETLGGAPLGNGQVILTNTADDIHPNDAGNLLLVAPVAIATGITS